MTILGNLVDNAIDAVERAATRGWSRSTLTRLADRRCTVRVADSGPGVPAGLAEQVFGAAGPPRPPTVRSGAGWGWRWSVQAVRRYDGARSASPPPSLGGAPFDVRIGIGVPA